MIQELTFDEIGTVDGAQLTATQVVVYTLIGAAGVATGGTAAIAGGFLLAMTGYLA